MAIITGGNDVAHGKLVLRCLINILRCVCDKGLFLPTELPWFFRVYSEIN